MRDIQESPEERIAALEAENDALRKEIEARETVESGLRARLAKFRDFAECASEWRWEMGPDLRFTNVTKQYEHATGIGPEQPIGKRREEIGDFKPGDEKLARHLDDLEAQRPFWKFEYSQTGENGEPLHFSVSGRPVFDAYGGFQGYRGVARDITASRIAARELREARDLSRTVMDAVPFEFVLKDTEGRYLQVNRMWERAFGCTNEEAVGKLPQEIIPGEFSDVFAEWDRRVLEEGRSIENEEQAPQPDGSIRDFVAIRFPLADADGKISGLGLIAMDITERRAVERALEDSEAQFRTITDNLPALIARFDRDGRYTFANRTAEQWYGRPLSDIVGKNILEIFGSGAYEKVKPHIETVLSGEPARFEGSLDYPDGANRDIEITFVPDRTAAGEVQGWLALAQDITERKRAESALRGSEGQLRTVIDNLPALIVRFDRQRRFSVVNETAEVWYARPASEIVGKTVAEMLGDEIGERFRPHMGWALGGQDVVFEVDIPYPDGVCRGIECTYVPDRAPDGTVQGVFAFVQDITERKQAERALRGSEEQLRTITDNLPVLITRFDRNGRFEFVNRTAETWYGRPEAEIIGKPIPELFSPESCAKVMPWIERALKGESVVFEDTILYPDGETKHVEILYLPDFETNGEVRGCIALVQDLTGRKAAEQALRESEAQLRTITDNLPVFIARFDRDARYRFVNGIAGEWYRRPVSEIVGRTISDIFGEDVFERVKPQIDIVLSGQAVRFEGSIDYPDGKTREIEINFVPDRTFAGEVQGWFTVVQDITARKASEQALRESEEQLRTITDNLPVSIAYVDRDERFRFANRTAENWYGVPAAEIAGTRFADLASPDAYARLKPKFDTVMTGQNARFEEDLQYPGGATRNVDVTYIADTGENGETRGCFSLVQDITARKRLEAELLRKERLAAMGQLTGTVAHELRNPLGAVSMSLSVINRKCMDAGLDLDRALARAARGIERSDRIVTELLDFARAKGLQRQAADLDDCISGLLEEFEIPSGIELVFSPECPDMAVQVDREELRRAMINVLDNACHAMSPEAGQEETCGRQPPRLTVETRPRDGRVCITVSDTGPGMPANVLAQVLEPLFSTKSFGTGLGLPTVKRIMEDHGGGLEINSEVGKGTWVVLWLPVEGER